MTTHSMPNRRQVLLGTAALAAGSAMAASPAGAQQQQQVRHSAGTEAPKLRAPANATDCHFHIYDSSFPVAPNAVLKPPEASVEDYKALQRRLGLSRCVLVQPSTYGTDNRAYMGLIPKLGGLERARMVGVVDTSVADDELRRMHEAGVRGIRFNLVQAGATTIDMVEPLSRRVAPMGWHVQMHMLGDQIAQAGDMFMRLPSRIVFDHRARLPQPQGVNHPAFAVIRRLLDKGNTWVKLSGAYFDSKSGPPGYEDSTAVARALFQAAPQRMVWGSDWPHPTEPADKKPDDAVLFDLLSVWVPDEAARHRVLVENPAELYDFPKG
ncbi:MAG: amidohydrolase family protein [Acetobacteraceae bacterium]|nr:amidohydrolase family protein [Acetobacteraceae bacterium]